MTSELLLELVAPESFSYLEKKDNKILLLFTIISVSIPTRKITIPNTFANIVFFQFRHIENCLI